MATKSLIPVVLGAVGGLSIVTMYMSIVMFIRNRETPMSSTVVAFICGLICLGVAMRVDSVLVGVISSILAVLSSFFSMLWATLGYSSLPSKSRIEND